MKVIFNTINTIQVTVFILNYSCNIGIEFVDMILLNGRQAVFCPKYNMIQVLTIT